MKKFSIFLLVTIMIMTCCSCKKQKDVNDTSSENFDDIPFASEDEDNGTSSADTSSTENVQSKTESSVTSSSSSQTSQTTSGAKKETNEVSNNKIVVACWGDSITQGAGIINKSYPIRLGEMLGSNYCVYNGGDAGETTLAISVRQGATKVYTRKAVTFSPGNSTAKFGYRDSSTNSTFKPLSMSMFVTNGQNVEFTASLGNQISINDATIGGKKYSIRFKNYAWNEAATRTWDMTIERYDDISSSFTIPAGTEIVLNNTSLTKKGGIDIYCVGANDSNDPAYADTLITETKKMVAYHGSDKYLVIIPYWFNSDEVDAKYVAAFGKHAVNFRTEAYTNGLTYEKLSATEKDNETIKDHKVPASFCFDNIIDNVHLSEYGYHFLAHLLYDRGKQLGFFK